jgi:acyl-CoA hydrolase
MLSPRFFHRLSEAAEFVFSSLGNEIRMATPLGLGKPNQLVNLLYERAKRDPQVQLTIYTALSLSIPHAHSELEKRFLNPFLKKHFGEDYPELTYVKDRLHGAQPTNVRIHEFYMQAAQNLHISRPQREYTSLNYTHVARSLVDKDINLVVQMVAKDAQGRYSLSCNPDLTLDLVDVYGRHNKQFLMVGVVHPDLPFMSFDAEVPPSFFDIIVESSEVNHQLFALPRTPLSATDHLIGLYASQLIEDDGTLQIGIGSLSDAIVAAAILRQKNNSAYREVVARLWQGKSQPPSLHHESFVKGLYGTSEMVMDAFMHLRKAGILKREIFDLDEEKKRYLHGAFFLGSKDFYAWLRDLSAEDRRGFCMTRVSKVNDLYDRHEMALRRQRKKACFFNICMNVTLLGGAASETLEDGQVVSGVGGQYNFVAMAHELPDARSVLMLKSVREHKGRRQSNIVWSHGQATIPRHLRDIVITEYGIAFLFGKSDEEVIQALIEISDSEFQGELIETAQKFGKLRLDYHLPESARHNYPENLQKFLRAFPADFFPAFPFGSDFDKSEENLAVALSYLQKAQYSPPRLLRLLWTGWQADKKPFQRELERLQLARPRTPLDWLYKNLVLGSLLTTRT